MPWLGNTRDDVAEPAIEILRWAGQPDKLAAIVKALNRVESSGTQSGNRGGDVRPGPSRRIVKQRVACLGDRHDFAEIVLLGGGIAKRPCPAKSHARVGQQRGQ